MSAFAATANDVAGLMAEMGRKARAAAGALATASAERKHAALTGAAEALNRRRADILEANEIDLAAGRARGMTAAFIDRLQLTDQRIDAMIEGLRTIAGLPDPIGSVMAEWTRPNGLLISRVRTPLGVIAVIFESRPNVTADAGAH